MKKGFTLVELSIVLVIIGLLIGGILAAQSMINTAKIQSQVRQFQQYDAAISNFKTKFKYIPGDCPANICPGNADNTGNGLLNAAIFAGGSTPPNFFWQEPAMFFYHLYIMGDLATAYSDNSVCVIGPGGNFPLATIGRGGLTVSGDASGNVYYISISNGMPAGNCVGDLYVSLMTNGIFSPAEALAIDAKMDDSNPGTGNVAAISTLEQNPGYVGTPFILDTNNSATSCTIGGAKYNTAQTSPKTCNLSVKSDFK